MTRSEANRRAIAAGATREQIEAETALQRRAPAIPRRNMIKALSLHSWNNTPEDWLRLAGALNAQRN